MPPLVPSWPTFGTISQREHIPVHRLRYAAARLGVKPVGKAGGTYVFTEADAAAIVQTARRIQREEQF